jgi:hypothetical protein
MKNYKVIVKKVEYSVGEIDVTATSVEEAEKLALEMSKTKEFSDKNTEYLTEGSMEINSEEDVFWNIIEKLNWKKDGNYNRIKNELSELPKDTTKKLREFCYNKLDELSNRFDSEWLKHGSEGIDASDDGWYDIRAEVVGRGKKFYYSITKSKLQKMAIALDYKENFLYSFHDLI